MHTLLVDTRYFIKLCTFTVHNEYQEYILSKWRQQTWMCFNSSFNGLQVSFSVPYFASIKHFKICIYSYLYLIIIFEAYPSNLTLSGLNRSVARTVTRKQSRRNARILDVCSQMPSRLRWYAALRSIRYHVLKLDYQLWFFTWKWLTCKYTAW